MASTTAHVKWKRSVSADAKSNEIDLFVDGELVDHFSVGAGVETLDIPDLEEGRLVKVVIKVSDGPNMSGEASAERVVPDVTAPEPVTEVAIKFDNEPAV